MTAVPPEADFSRLQNLDPLRPCCEEQHVYNAFLSHKQKAVDEFVHEYLRVLTDLDLHRLHMYHMERNWKRFFAPAVTEVLRRLLDVEACGTDTGKRWIAATVHALCEYTYDSMTMCVRMHEGVCFNAPTTLLAKASIYSATCSFTRAQIQRALDALECANFVPVPSVCGSVLMLPIQLTRARSLAVRMALHPRLGAGSPLACLEPELLMAILARALLPDG